MSVASLLLAGIAVDRFAHRPYPWLSEMVDEPWRAPQVWARQHTEPWVRFLTPPHRTGWRIGSHRPSFGELNDGALLFQASDELISWADRMAQLGFEPGIFEHAETAGPRYAEALARIDASWCAERGIDYVVTEAARDVAVGEVVFTSPEFVIRRVR